MYITLLQSKIHRATVTGCELHYEGSISMPPSLIAAADMMRHQQVDILNVNNGARFTTYVIEGKENALTINGPAARLVQPGDIIIICAYAQVAREEMDQFETTILQMGEGNSIRSTERLSPR